MATSTPPIDPNSFNLFLELAKYLLGALLGSAVTIAVGFKFKFVKFVNKVKQKIEGSNNGVLLNVGVNNGTINPAIGSEVSTGGEVLAVKIEGDTQFVIDELQKLCRNSSFSEHYKKFYQLLYENSVLAAASEYLIVLLFVKDILLKRSTYNDHVDLDAYLALSGVFDELEVFVKKSVNDIEELKSMVDKFEKSFLRLNHSVLWNK